VNRHRGSALYGTACSRISSSGRKRPGSITTTHYTEDALTEGDGVRGAALTCSPSQRGREEIADYALSWGRAARGLARRTQRLTRLGPSSSTSRTVLAIIVFVIIPAPGFNEFSTASLREAAPRSVIT
jgi:hypothetical protein